MKTSIINIILAFTATSCVFAQDEPVLSGISPDTYDLCQKAPNCETYVAEDGQQRIRFIPGMEPGTAAYKAMFPITNATESPHEKREDNSRHTYLDYGVNSLNYGTQNPVDILHHCGYDYCHESYCDSSSCTWDTMIVGDTWPYGNEPERHRIVVSFSGQYDGWGERTNYVEAVKLAAQKGQRWSQVNWNHNQGSEEYQSWTSGSQWEGRQTDFIHFAKWDNGYFRGNIDVHIRVESLNSFSGWCGTMIDVIAASAGVFSGFAGGFLGFVKAACPR